MAIIQGHAMQSSSRGFYPKTLNGSLRFNDDDGAYLEWTPSSEGSRTTWTWSAWVKRCNIGSGQTLFSCHTGSSTAAAFQFMFDSGDNLNINGYTTTFRDTSAVYRDPSAWYHIVLAVDTTQSTASDRIKLYVNGEQVTSFATSNDFSASASTGINQASRHTIGAYDNGLGDDLDAYMAEVFFIDGTAHDADAFGETKNGVWVPKNVTSTDFTMGTNGFHLTFEDDAEVEAFNTVLYRGNGTTNTSITGTGFTPDLVWIKERTETRSHHLFDSVRRERRLYPDQTWVEDTATDTKLLSYDSDGFTITQGDNLNKSAQNYVAWCWDAGANNTITGHSSVTYTGNSSTQTISGFPFSPDLVWIKNRSSSSYGHRLIDTVRGATIAQRSHTAAADITETTGLTSFNSNGFILGSQGDYNYSGHNFIAWGWDAGDSDPVSNTDGSTTSTVKASTTNGFSIVQYEGSGASATIGHGLSSAPDFIISKNIDTTSSWPCYHVSTGADVQLLLNSTNGTSADTNGFSDVPTSTVINVGSGAAMDTNQTGTHIAYCWHDVTGKQKFGSYTGNGSTTGPTVTTGFRPGFILIKQTDVARGWYIYDATRDSLGPLSTYLRADLTNADATLDTIQLSDTGFQLISDNASFNQSSGTYIYAAFAGSYSDYITDYNTDGTTDSRVKASDTTGFSIVSYTGTGSAATVGHGLSTAPNMVIVKDRDSGTNFWVVGHSSLSFTSDNYLRLNGNGATEAGGGVAWNNTAPTSTTVSIGNSTVLNASGNDYIAYCWSEKAGYSKFSSYEGNNTATGPTVTTTFKPALVIIKNADGTGNWNLFDNTRATFPDNDLILRANLSAAEVDGSAEGGDAYEVEFTDTGFIPKASGASSRSQVNGTGTYIYAAFADTREAAFWLDQSGNDNDWQPENLDHNDTVADSPTDNFATLNPLVAGNVTLSDGNLKYQHTGSWTTTEAYSTIAIPEGSKFYFEVFQNSVGGAGTYCGVGITSNTTTSTTPYNGVGGWVYLNTGAINHDSTTLSTESSYTTGDTIAVAVDRENGTVKFYKDNTLEYTVSDSDISTGDLFFTVFAYTGTMTTNFGQQPFTYDPPE